MLAFRPDDRTPGAAAAQADDDEDDEDPDAEAVRRVAWIQYYLGLGDYTEATELGWDGAP